MIAHEIELASFRREEEARLKRMGAEPQPQVVKNLEPILPKLPLNLQQQVEIMQHPSIMICIDYYFVGSA